MATKAEKKNQLRKEIIAAAKEYSLHLAGKTFLYVYGNEFFEVTFPLDHFLHLTGVETKLDKKNFFIKAKKAQLTDRQFYFSSRYPYATAKKKLSALRRLPELTTDMVCILKDMRTQSVVYKLSVSNLEFTLGLTEDVDGHGKRRSELFLPMSLRVSDKSIEKSADGEIVDFIFSKSSSETMYNNLLVQDKNKKPIDAIKKMVCESLIKQLETNKET
ncbi:MAG: hypothetical protein IKR58_05585 [Lachnospiraceae bacterium]|nr:hypothetical protein [Lachnospiraceae bacterium]